MDIRAFMLTCPARASTRAETLERLAATDWGEPPELVVDDTDAERPEERQERTARRLLEIAGRADPAPDLVLFLEDDLDFNRHLRHNLLRWQPLGDIAPVFFLSPHA